MLQPKEHHYTFPMTTEICEGEEEDRGEGAKSHRGKLLLAQNSIMQVGKFLDNAPVGDPKQ